MKNNGRYINPLCDKTVYKKLLCLVLSIVLVAVSFAISAFAGEAIATKEVAGEMCMNYSGQKISQDAMLNYFANERNGGVGEVVYSGYSLLGVREKDFYNRIITTPVGTMSFKVDFSPYLSSAEFDAIDFTAVMHAVCLDHPEMFWYNGYSYSYSYIKSTGQVTSITYTIKSPVVQGTQTAVYSAGNIASYNTAMWNEFHQVANQLNLANLTGYKFVKTIHDYLCENVEYVNDRGSCHDPYGTLVNGDAVCQGYAETFKMFCDYYGIPVVNITGTGNGGAHMWNAVQMSDGLWYLLDITWDDQSPQIFYDFFLVGLETKDTYFGSNAFNVSHISDGSPYLPSLDYALNEYEPPAAGSFEGTYNYYADADKNYLVLSPFDALTHSVYYDGTKVTGITYETGSQFATSDGKRWEVVMIGDIDSDGDVTIEDYQIAINIALSGDNAVQSTTDIAADICRDGYIDVMDVYVIQLMESYLRTEVDVA